MCNKCKVKHSSNPRLAAHKIVPYQSMIFNPNKFGKTTPQRKDDSDLSVSPQRKNNDREKSKSPANGRPSDGMSVISNSSGRFSMRNALGG